MRRKVRAAAALAVLVAGCLLSRPVYFLEVRALPGGQLLLRVPLPPTRRFELRYTHSWDKTPVWEVFTVDGQGGLVLLEEDYLWMGAGLDFQPAADFDFSGGRVRVRRNRTIGELRLAVGTVAGHRLALGEVEVPLSRFAPPGSRVLFTAQRLPWIASLFGPGP